MKQFDEVHSNRKREIELEYVADLITETFKAEGLKVIRLSETETHLTSAYDGIFVELQDKRVISIDFDVCRNRKFENTTWGKLGL